MSDTLQSHPEPDTAPSVSESREWQIQDLVSVLYRRRWAAIATFLVAVGGVTAHTLTTTPIYEAHAQLLVAERTNIITFQGEAEPQTAQRGYLETQYRLLQSRSLARRVVDELDLWSVPDTPSPWENTSRSAREFLSRWWPTSDLDATGSPDASRRPAPAEGGLLVPGETLAESAVIDRFLSNLHVDPVSETRLIDVSYESADSALAARVVNTLTEIYIRQSLEERSQASEQASAWLANQLAEQRRKTETSELALQTYREQEDSLSLEDGQNIVVQRLNALNTAVTQAKTERIAVEAVYRQLDARQGDREALDTFPSIRSNGLLQQVRTRLANLQRERTQLAGSLGAKHPEMVRLDTAIDAAETELSAEIAKTVDSLRQEYQATLAREQELTAALETQKSSALALNRQAIEYGVLLREVESNRQIYGSLLQRANETAVSAELKSSNIEVVDAASVPRSPVRPNTRSAILIGLLLGTVLAFAAAFVQELLDSRIQTPSDIRGTLRLPFLGMLPYIRRRALKGNAPLLSSGVPAVYAEACRALRTNVLASAGAKGSRSLLVTSAAPGDGKSVVAVNLAVLLGRSGRRVLLVDADLRRPILHQLLEHPQEPGLSEVVTGKRKPSEAIVETRCPGVWLLASGACPSNPSELLGSRRFQEFIRKVGEYFDWVIIDSPPVMAVTDPAVIARLASGVLFVVNARRTRRRVARAALDRLELAGASFAGAVLNAITLDRDHYYNAQYYLPFYGDYLSDTRTA